MKFLITFLLMFRLKESKLRPVDKSMRKLFERNKSTFFRLNFFLNAFRVITPAYIPTTGIITTVYSKTAPWKQCEKTCIKEIFYLKAYIFIN